MKIFGNRKINCPHCGNHIQKKALKCKWCGKNIKQKKELGARIKKLKFLL